MLVKDTDLIVAQSLLVLLATLSLNIYIDLASDWLLLGFLGNAAFGCFAR